MQHAEENPQQRLRWRGARMPEPAKAKKLDMTVEKVLLIFPTLTRATSAWVEDANTITTIARVADKVSLTVADSISHRTYRHAPAPQQVKDLLRGQRYDTILVHDDCPDEVYTAAKVANRADKVSRFYTAAKVANRADKVSRFN